MANHTTLLRIVAEDEQMPNRAAFSLDGQRALRDTAAFLEALAAGHRVGSVVAGVDDGDAVAASGSFACSGTAHGAQATGSYALSGVGGTAASGTVTLGGGAGDVTIVTDGTSVGPVAFNTDDATTAQDCITALNADVTFAAKATASDGGVGIITITWKTKGVVGNSKTLTASRSAGTATASGATLAGGVQGAVTVVINGTSVGPVDTTNLTDTAAATAVAAAIEANGTLGPLLAAVGSTTNVNLTWGTQGTVGNAVTLAAGVSATGTATRSGATLAGGTDTSVTATINGVALVVNTTTTTTDAQVATLVNTAINASVNALIDGVVTSSITSPTTTVNVVADTKGTTGNWITLAASGTGFTASGNRLTGGTNDSTTVTITR
jgi:hypothetical protein